MGSWNGTCALTNLPVMAGEPVYVLLLLEGAYYNKYVGHHCYANNYYTPLPLFFEGDYNDYGAVENCHGEFLPVILDSVRNSLIELQQGKNQYHDIAVTKDKFNIELLFDADHEGRLFVLPDEFGKKNGRVKQRRLTHIIIKKQALDTFLTKFKIYRCHPKTYESYKLSYPEFIRETVDKLAETVSELRDLVKEIGFLPIMLETSTGLRSTLRCSGEYYQDIIPISKILSDKIIAGESTESLIRQLTAMEMLISLFEMGRRMWIKPSGSGSQNDDTSANRLIASLINQEARSIHKRKKQDDLEYKKIIYCEK